jgi:hypothetical protein
VRWPLRIILLPISLCLIGIFWPLEKVNEFINDGWLSLRCLLDGAYRFQRYPESDEKYNSDG